MSRRGVMGTRLLAASDAARLALLDRAYGLRLGPPVVLAALLAAALIPLAGASQAAGDGGEAGLVIQHGNGELETYCVAFEGDGMAGDELLQAAGVNFEQVSGLVCTVGERQGEGCPGASSLSSCTCQCRSGGAGCRYWSYFTKEYGEAWTYSVSGFAAQPVSDGGMQAWRWGEGGPNSAPPPRELTFEQVCGHSPGALNATVTPSGAPSTPTMTATASAEAAGVPAPEQSPPAQAPISTATPTSADRSPTATSGPLAPTSIEATVATVEPAEGSVAEPPANDRDGWGRGQTALLLIAMVALGGAGVAGAIARRGADGD